MTREACALTPEGLTAVRTLPATCGSATFAIDAALRRFGSLRLATGEAVYVRTITLSYGASTGGQHQQTQLALHRLLAAGEFTDAFATTHRGLVLLAVTVDVNPAGYGAAQVALALADADGRLADAAMQAVPKTEAAPIATAALASTAWMMIGSTVAHLPELRDRVVVGRDKGRFDSLVISSRGGDLPVQSVLVSPVNGTPFAVDLRTVVAPGTLSRVIPLDPPDFVHEVTVTYGTPSSLARQPTLEVRGHYSDNWLGKVGENRHYAGGWVMLGTADIVVSPHSSAPRSNFRVDGHEGPFKKLRFVARRGSVSLGDVTIDVGDGRTETVPVNAVLLPDAQSVPFALAAGSLPIASIVLSPKLTAKSRLDATVEVWAQY